MSRLLAFDDFAEDTIFHTDLDGRIKLISSFVINKAFLF
jgi:hypothetical protein